MEKAELINKLYEGETAPTNDIYNFCKDFFTPTNIRLLLKKFVILANMIEYDYLKNPQSSVFQIDFGKASAIYDLLNWSCVNDKGKREIAQIAWRREIADFLTETPETLNSIHHDSTLQQDK